MEERNRSFPRRWVRALSVAFAVCLVGCEPDGSGAARSGGSGAETGAETEVEQKVVVSSSRPSRPQRLVALAPNVTEILFALGAGERVVAATKFADYPPAAESLPSVGSYIRPDFESIVAHRPELVVGVTSGGDRDVADKLRRAGMAYAFVQMETFEQTLAGIGRIGEWIGRGERADELVEEIRTELEAIRGTYVSDGGDRPRVLMVRGREPIVAAGPGSLGAAFIERVGARNVLAGADSSHPRLDLEKVIELAPDVIVDTTMKGEATEGYWREFDSIPAVRRGRVRRVTADAVLRPGPRLPEGLRTVAEAIYGTSSGAP